MRCVCLSTPRITIRLWSPCIRVLNSRIEDTTFGGPDLLVPSILFYQVCTASLSWVELTLFGSCIIWMACGLWVWNLARIGIVVLLDFLGNPSTTQKWVFFSRLFLSTIILLLLRELFFDSSASLEVLAGSKGISSKVRRRSRSWAAHVSTLMNILLEATFLISLLIGRLLSSSLLHRNLLSLVIIIDSVSALLVDRGHSVGTKHPFLQRNVLPVLILLRIRIWNLNDIILNILLQVLFWTHVTILLHLRGANRSTWWADSHRIQTLATDTSNEAIGSLLTHGYTTNSRMNTVRATTPLRLILSILLHHKIVVHMIKYLSLLAILGSDFVIDRHRRNSIIGISIHFEYIVIKHVCL